MERCSSHVIRRQLRLLYLVQLINGWVALLKVKAYHIPVPAGQMSQVCCASHFMLSTITHDSCVAFSLDMSTKPAHLGFDWPNIHISAILSHVIPLLKQIGCGQNVRPKQHRNVFERKCRSSFPCTHCIPLRLDAKFCCRLSTGETWAWACSGLSLCC